MNISDILYHFLPNKTFVFLRKMYRKYQQIRYPKFTEEKFKTILSDDLGIKMGMVVFVHSSVDKLNLGFTPFRLLEILIETVGEEGTVLFPCWHYPGRAANFLKNKDAVFNVKRSPTMLGLLPELARRHPLSVRSLHPTASVVAIGKLANELIFEHHLDIYPNGIKSPLYKIMDYDSKIIGLGERVVSLSFVHVVEDVMKETFPVKVLENQINTCQVIDTKNNAIEVETRIPHINITNRDIPRFFDTHISSKAYKRFRCNGVNFFCLSARQAFAEMKLLAEKKITVYSVERHQ